MKILLAIIIIGFITVFIILPMFLVIDWTVGEHGRLTITAVDKNLFGTHTVYVRNSDSAFTPELQEMRYCIDSENVELVKVAKEKIGVANTTLVYPDTRIGLFGFSKCSSAPLKEIR
jgi:hypothetical protein